MHRVGGMKISSIIAKNCQHIAAIDIHKYLIFNFLWRKKGVVAFSRSLILLDNGIGREINPVFYCYPLFFKHLHLHPLVCAIGFFGNSIDLWLGFSVAFICYTINRYAVVS